jgi:K+-sensing histidine kinase KdpD
VNGHETDLELMRQAQSLAQWLTARLTVVYAFRLGAARGIRKAIDRDRRYARSVGASLVELPAFSPKEAIAEFGCSRGVTHVVLDDHRQLRGANSDTLAGALLDRLAGLDIYYVPACRHQTAVHQSNAECTVGTTC